MVSRSPYEILGVRSDATDIEVKAAYSAILGNLKNGGLSREDAMARLDEARAAFKLIGESRREPSRQSLPTQALPLLLQDEDFEASAGSSFLANLNVFLPAWVLLYASFGTFVSLVVMIPLGLIGYMIGGIKSNWTVYLFTLLPHIVTVASLSLLWYKKGLVPANLNPERENRYRIGHTILGITTTVVLAGLAAPFLMSKLSGNSDWGMLLWFVIPLFGVAALVWAAGLYMIWSSRATS